MAESSGISWTDNTHNHWRGCTKVSPGCANCYAERLVVGRLKGEWGKGAPRQLAKESTRKKPMQWNAAAEKGFFSEVTRDGSFVARGDARKLVKQGVIKEGDRVVRVRPRIFSASLSDWLDPEVPAEWLASLLETIRVTTHLDWLLLTKRPELWKERLSLVASEFGSNDPLSFASQWLCGDAPPNVWVGTTVEDSDRAIERFPSLMSIPARVRFLSCEPLLGPVSLRWMPAWKAANGRPSSLKQPFKPEVGTDHLDGLRQIDWVICGGESGPNARPMNPDWARNLRDECREAGVAFHFKQWGEWAPSDGKEEKGESIFFRDGQAMKLVGKAAAGRELDGQIFDQYPILETPSDYLPENESVR